MEIFEHAQTQVVPAELLADAMRLHSRLDADDRRDITEQLICVINAIHSVEIAEDKGWLGIAMAFRIRALAEFIMGHLGSKLTISAEDGSRLVSWDLIQCAAKTPLREGSDGHAVFDETEFLNCYLKLTSNSGSA